MLYKERIQRLAEHIDKSLADFSASRTRGRMPTQVSSEFLTNKEQGDWAENTLLSAINNSSDKYIAVHYGKNDDINAGDENFKAFFEAYQDELDEIGKRPDILIFLKKDYPYNTCDISSLSEEELDKIIPLAKCGIEVRSSAFLCERYEEYAGMKKAEEVDEAMKIKDSILNDFPDLLMSKDKDLYDLLVSITPDNIQLVSFRSKSWKASEDLCELSDRLKRLNQAIKEMNKRNFLSITPKVEDLKVVYTWVQKYNVPHYYVQVFFDKAYGVSFERILTLISSPDMKNKAYFIEADEKNQGKTTIKVHANTETEILKSIEMPISKSEMKELSRGRLLYFVKFAESKAVVNKEEFAKLFGFVLE